jgi:hypothetical protein
MPFREGYGSIFDAPTRATLQDVFEFVWLAMTDAFAPSVSREKIAGMVVAAHKAGMTPDHIKEQVFNEILQSR